MESQAEIWQILFGFVDSMALKAAVELRIADIIHSHGAPLTLSQIASSLQDSPIHDSLDISYLGRLMRLLVRKKIFAASIPSDGVGETFYGLTPLSEWVLHDSPYSLAPMVIIQNHPLLLNPWHYISRSIREGGSCFEKAHGCEIWEFASRNPEFNTIFNNGMACVSKIVAKEIPLKYKDGFQSIGSLVDVAGGTGGLIIEIVKSYSHIKGINFDLPHVIATAPEHEGVTHIAGDMFEAIPKADAVIMKWILHDWDDEHCNKILKNCRKAIPERTGKIIIVDSVLEAEGKEVFDDARMAVDLAMMADTATGKERTYLEWKNLLEEGGFPRLNVIKIPALPSILRLIHVHHRFDSFS